MRLDAQRLDFGVVDQDVGHRLQLGLDGRRQLGRPRPELDRDAQHDRLRRQRHVGVRGPQRDVELPVLAGRHVERSLLDRIARRLHRDAVGTGRQDRRILAGRVGARFEGVRAVEAEAGAVRPRPARSETWPRTLPLTILATSATSIVDAEPATTFALPVAGSNPAAATVISAGPGGSGTLWKLPSGSVATRARGWPANDTTASGIGLPSDLFLTLPTTVPIDGSGAFSTVRVTTTGRANEAVSNG